MTRLADQPVTMQDWVTRFPIYYGWVSLGAGTFGVIMTGPGQTFIVQAFIEEFIGDLGIPSALAIAAALVRPPSSAPRSATSATPRNRCRNPSLALKPLSRPVY